MKKSASRSKKHNSQRESPSKKDTSAVSRLVDDLGLLILEPSYDRYYADKEFERGMLMTCGEPPSVQNLKRFIPVLQKAVPEMVADSDLLFCYSEKLHNLEWIEDVVCALHRTLDFDFGIRDLIKTLKRKFEGSDAIRLPLRANSIISPDVISHCRAVLSMIREFKIDENELDPWSQEAIDAALADVNIYSVLLDAEELLRTKGVLHFATYEYLLHYQSNRGSGRPRKYVKVMFSVLIAEFYEKPPTYSQPALINDLSEGRDFDCAERKVIEERKPYFDSPLARIITAFSTVSNSMDPIRHDEEELSYYRDFLQNRHMKRKLLKAAGGKLLNVTEELKKSSRAVDFQKVIFFLDSIK